MNTGRLVLQRWRALSATQQEVLSGSAIASLPPEWHKILLLVEGEGKSVEDVATSLHQSVASVEDSLSKARDWVYRYLTITLMRGQNENGIGGGTPTSAVAALPLCSVAGRKAKRKPIYEAEKNKRNITLPLGKVIEN